MTIDTARPPAEAVRILKADPGLTEHGQAIISLLDQYARDPMGGGSPLSEHARQHLLGELRRRDNAHVILALVDGKPAGLINCFEGFSTFAC